MPRQLLVGTFFALPGLLVGYILATAWLDQSLARPVDYLTLARLLPDLWAASPDLALQIALIIACSTLGFFLFGAHNASEGLTTLGTSSWQTPRQMRRNGLLGTPGKGFVLARTSGPKGRGRYITSDAHPNALIVAPTGAGKGVGFVYPNLLTFEGSTVTLDIKGENYATTARTRAAMGDRIYKFAPVQFGEASYRYNPLERIGRLSTYAQITYELRKIATLFLQADGAGEWLNGAIQLFTAAGAVAHERNAFTLGGIHTVLAEGEGDLKRHIARLAATARDPALRLELGSLAKLEPRTLSSYLSVLNNAGFDLWSNPHIAALTSESDFSFADLRRTRASIYFIVADADLKPLAGLVRLFFNELVGTIQKARPGPDEPHPVMLILDEFHRLGKMSEVAEAMTTIRGFNGRMAIITQTIPKLDAIYSYEERLSIQGGAGLKLYMTPSEEMTIEDLSQACGMTTKRTVSKSRRAGLLERATVSERTEERPLLTEDEARRLPRDAVIIIVNGEQPVKARRIVHYQDPNFTRILAAQDNLSWDGIERDLLSARVAKVERQVAGEGKSQASAQPRPAQDDMQRLLALLDEAFDLYEKAIKLKDAPAPGHSPQDKGGAEPEPETAEPNPRTAKKPAPGEPGDAPEEDAGTKRAPASRQLSLLPEMMDPAPQGEKEGLPAS